MQIKDSNRDRRDFGILAIICLVLQVAVAPNIPLGSALGFQGGSGGASQSRVHGCGEYRRQGLQV